MTLWPIISHALLFGVILSGVLFTLMLVVVRVNPEIMLKDCPPDVQTKYGPMSERSKRQRIPWKHCGSSSRPIAQRMNSFMKILNVGFIILLVFQTVCGQAAPSTTKTSPQSTSTSARSYPNAKTQANQLAEAVLKGDYEKAADLTYPKLIELIGGRAKYLEVLEGGMKEAFSDSFRIISTVVGDPTDVIEVGSDVYAVLPMTMKFKVAEGVLVGQAAMIGVSNDRGEHWTFVDSGKASNQEQLKILFPAVADRLKLPERKPPVLERTP